MTANASASARLQSVEAENKRLREELEDAYVRMLAFADTLQNNHIARVNDLVSDLNENSVPSSSGADTFKSDLDAAVKMMDSQHNTIMTSTSGGPAEQAAQLRILEDKARIWAKKFLHKVKAAATAAERQAGITQEDTLKTIAPHRRGTRDREAEKEVHKVMRAGERDAERDYRGTTDYHRGTLESVAPRSPLLEKSGLDLQPVVSVRCPRCLESPKSPQKPRDSREESRGEDCSRVVCQLCASAGFDSVVHVGLSEKKDRACSQPGRVRGMS